MRRLVIAGCVLPVLLFLLPSTSAVASSQRVAGHAVAASYVAPRLSALRWAETQAGCWYSWGGAGPCGAGYDCSGLVVAAYARVGIRLPHNTVSMLYSGKLVWEPRSQARWGDLVMWGGGAPFHVELFAGWNGERTFGAHSSGTRVSFTWNGGWWYSAENFYRVV